LTPDIRKGLRVTAAKFRNMPGRDKIGSGLRYVTVPNIYRFFGLFLIIISVSFYLGWSVAYGTWGDIGLYSFTIVLLVFGILTLLLVDEKERTKRIKEQNP
jgi:hypothetical protein